MNIEITTSETCLDEDDRALIQRRVKNALRDYHDDINQVQLWMVGILVADELESQYCLINVKMTDGSLVACDGTHSVLRTAINHAIERVGIEVDRNLGRRRRQSTTQIRRPGSSYHDPAASEQMSNRL